MGAGGYHKTAAYRRRTREGKESFKMLMGVLMLPFLPFILLFKFFGLFKKKK